MCLTEITCRFDVNKGIKIKYFQVSYINDLAETQEARQDPHPPPLPLPPPPLPEPRNSVQHVVVHWIYIKSQF